MCNCISVIMYIPFWNECMCLCWVMKCRPFRSVFVVDILMIYHFKVNALLKSFMILENWSRVTFTYMWTVRSWTSPDINKKWNHIHLNFIHFHWWVMKKRDETLPKRLLQILRMLTWGDEWALVLLCLNWASIPLAHLSLSIPLHGGNGLPHKHRLCP